MCWAGVCDEEPRVFRCRDYGKYSWIYFRGVTAPTWPGSPLYEASRTHSFRHIHSVGTLWTCDHLVAGNSTWQHTTLTRTDIHALGGIQTRNPNKRAVVDPRFRPRGNRDGLFVDITPCNFVDWNRSFGVTCCLSLQSEFSNLKAEVNRFLRNVDDYLPNYTSSHKEGDSLDTISFVSAIIIWLNCSNET
jgi:hypothetical protein